MELKKKNKKEKKKEWLFKYVFTSEIQAKKTTAGGKIFSAECCSSKRRLKNRTRQKTSVPYWDFPHNI